MLTTGTVERGGVQASERVLAPDLARGLMLLLIAASNTAFHLWASEHGPSGWQPIDGTVVDRAVQFLMIVLLDLRIYPLFAFLFGYGMMQLYQRQTAAGTSEKAAVRLLRRRSLWLIVFGFVHAALLMAGDIVGFYGAASLILGWLFLRRRTRTLMIWSGIVIAFTLLLAAPAIWAIATGDLAAAGSPGTEATIVVYGSGEENWLDAAARRLSTWGFLVGAGATFGVVQPPLLLGLWAARHRVLEEPGRHLRLLRWTVAVGIPVAWLGALPAALAHVGALDAPPQAVSEGGVFASLAEVTGTAGGLGYIAAITLICHAMSARARHSTPVVAVAAVGKRSLSAYLTHSLIFAPILAAWGLGLGAHLSSATMALFAAGVWLVTVFAAYALERRGLRGPAETLLRRLIYPRAVPNPVPTRPSTRDEQGRA